MTLDFNNEEGKRRFEFCYVGFILGGSLQKEKGITVLRREVGLYDKLESISELKPCGKKMPNGEPERQLVNGGQIELTTVEFDLLYGYISIVPWQTGIPAKQALETLDWLQKNGRTS